MPTLAPVFIEFVPDLSKIENAGDQLAASGSISKPLVDEMRKVAKAADDAAAHLTKDTKAMSGGIADLSRAVKGVSKEMTAGFAAGMEQGLTKVTAAMNDLVTETEQVETAQKSLKQELKELTAAIAQATLEGTNSGPAFQSLVDRAGEIKDAMGDATAQINVFASDTGKLDEVLGVMTGVAAAFSIAQGATALFGSESEELQEAMVRLQGTTAVLTGLQEISNLLEKQSAVYKAATRVQTMAATAATNLETASHSKNIVIKGAAAIATRVLNMVMAANPAFLLVAAFSALAGALVYFSGTTKDAKVNVDEFNLALEQQKRLLDAEVTNIQQAGKLAIAGMKARGESEEAVHRKTMEFIEQEAVANETKAMQAHMTNEFTINGNRLLLNNLQAAADSRKKIEKAMTQTQDEETKKRLQIQLDTTNQVIGFYETANERRRGIEVDNANFAADQAEKARQKAKEAADKRAADAKDAAAKAREAEAQRLADIKANIERQLLTAEEGSKKQLDLRVKLAAAERDISAFGAKSAAEKQLIYAQYLKNIGDLTTAFHKEQRDKALQAQVDVLSAELQNDRLAARDREQLQVELMNRQREIEIIAAEGNAAKIKEINARVDHEIAAQRLQIRQQAFQEEQDLLTASTSTRTRALSTLADNEKASAAARLLAIRDLERADADSVARRMEQNETLYADGLITANAYKTELARLKDEEAQIHENAEKKKTDITTAEIDKQKAKERERVESMLDTAQQVMDAVNNIAAAFAERTMQRIEGEKQALDKQKEAGIISEKEHAARMARLDREEAAAKTKAARREKAMALFAAAVAGARAIMQAVASAPPPANIAAIVITSALVAAQLAAIAAKPIPKFRYGTRSAPKGLAVVGDAGPELVQGKGWHYADSPQLMMMQGGERVYTATETRRIFERITPMADTSITKAKPAGSPLKIDYRKMAKAFGEEIEKHPKLSVSMDENGLTAYLLSKNSKTTYLNKRHRL